MSLLSAIIGMAICSIISFVFGTRFIQKTNIPKDHVVINEEKINESLQTAFKEGWEQGAKKQHEVILQEIEKMAKEQKEKTTSKND